MLTINRNRGRGFKKAYYPWQMRPGETQLACVHLTGLLIGLYADALQTIADIEWMDERRDDYSSFLLSN